jgi:Rab-GTPase-TBC domain
MDHVDETGSSTEPNTPSLGSLRKILDSLTIHDFWANIVANYQLAHRAMPVFLFNKIRDGGVPPPLRRLVWASMAGITEDYLAEMTNIYMRLEVGGIGGWDKDIGRDLNRTWPEVEMFKDEDGEGQRGLRGVLGGYSVWDNDVGYCQGYLLPD